MTNETDDERRAREIAPIIFRGTDYDEVPLREIFPPRPRYQHLYDRCIEAVRAIRASDEANGMVGWISADSLGYYYHKGGEVIGPFSNEAAAISAMITSHDLQYREHAKGKN